MNDTRKRHRLVPVSDEQLLREHGIYLRPSTLRKEHSLGINPQIFVRVGGRLFVDADQWDARVDAAKEKTARRVDRLKGLGLVADGE